MPCPPVFQIILCSCSIPGSNIVVLEYCRESGMEPELEFLRTGTGTEIEIPTLEWNRN